MRINETGQKGCVAKIKNLRNLRFDRSANSSDPIAFH